MPASPRVVSSSESPPDPSIARAVGRHHSFETAIADLIDNSIDAEAARVTVRFLQKAGRVVGLQVVDDGRGMDAEAIDSAMVFGKRRAYGASDLGHFGLGLKAASLSQADELRVFSRKFGAPAVGRMVTATAPTLVGTMDDDEVDIYLTAAHGSERGTMIEWVNPRTFLSSDDAADRSRWIDERIGALRSHLGIVFHRLLEKGEIAVDIDVVDINTGSTGFPLAVLATDPFGYHQLPGGRFPAPLKIFPAEASGQGMVHLWPAAQSGRIEFRLDGKPGSLFQGLYFYRGDRLLQMGGWNTLTVARPELEYARIAIDIDEALARHVTINPEKAGLELDSDLKAAILAARVGDAGLTFAQFLGAAEDTRRESRRYTKRPVALVEPARGFDADMLEAFEASVEVSRSKPVDIRWRVMTTENPVDIDLDRRTIWLNEQYRDVIAGRNSEDSDDAPFIKTLLMIVYSKYFEGAMLGSREKSELAAWEQLLTAALRDEISHQARKMGRQTDDG